MDWGDWFLAVIVTFWIALGIGFGWVANAITDEYLASLRDEE